MTGNAVCYAVRLPHSVSADRANPRVQPARYESLSKMFVSALAPRDGGMIEDVARMRVGGGPFNFTSSICEQRLEFGPLRAAHGRPASQQQPALAAPVFAHDGTGAKELLAADFIERSARVLEHVEFVEHDLGMRSAEAMALRYGRCMSVHTAVMAPRWRPVKSVSKVIAVASQRSWGHPRSDPDSIAPGLCDGRSRCTCSDGCRAAQSESPDCR